MAMTWTLGTLGLAALVAAGPVAAQGVTPFPGPTPIRPPSPTAPPRVTTPPVPIVRPQPVTPPKVVIPAPPAAPKPRDNSAAVNNAIQQAIMNQNQRARARTPPRSAPRDFTDYMTLLQSLPPPPEPPPPPELTPTPEGLALARQIVEAEIKAGRIRQLDNEARGMLLDLALARLARKAAKAPDPDLATVRAALERADMKGREAQIATEAQLLASILTEDELKVHAAYVTSPAYAQIQTKARFLNGRYASLDSEHREDRKERALGEVCAGPARDSNFCLVNMERLAVDDED